MDYYYYAIKIYSEINGGTYIEYGILIADSYEEARDKLLLFYDGDIIIKIGLTFMSNEGVCILGEEGGLSDFESVRIYVFSEEYDDEEEEEIYE